MSNLVYWVVLTAQLHVIVFRPTTNKILPILIQVNQLNIHNIARIDNSNPYEDVHKSKKKPKIVSCVIFAYLCFSKSILHKI
jgi:hypothetical protein